VSKALDLVAEEEKRQSTTISLIASENIISSNVKKALGSSLSNKYSEGFVGNRYYGGNEVVDQIEQYTCNLANQIFGTSHAIVQPYSGSPANLESYCD